MENKKTTELLDLVGQYEKKEDWDNFDKCAAELRQRFPFSEILGVEESIDNMKDDIKLLKRHKHDDKSGDVMVRI